MEDHDPPVCVLHLVDVDSKSKIAKKLLRHADRAIARLSPDYGPGWFVGDTEK